MSNYIHLQQLLYCRPWLILPRVHESLCGLLDAKMAGTLAKREDGEDICGDKVEVAQMTIEDGIACIPVGGVIGQRLGKWERGAGAVDVNDICNEIEEANANPKVNKLLFEFDTPGGVVSGIPECASLIRESRKECFAFVPGLCASAGYWLGASCSMIMATPSAELGSIGVYIPWADYSEYYRGKGINVSLIKSGKYKGMGYPGTSLTPEQLSFLQAEVDDLASSFKAHISACRSDMKPEDMEGQSFIATKAVKRGLVDAIVRDRKQALALIK